MEGFNWSLALGGQSIEGVNVVGAKPITGIGTATVTEPNFTDCDFGAGTFPPCHMHVCGVGVGDGLFTGGSAGQYAMVDCFSLVAGSGSPDFKFDGLGASTGINARGYKGGSAWTLDSNCTISLEAVAGGGQTFTTGGASVEIRGIMRALTLVLSGAGTVQMIGNVGPVTISGTATTTVNLYGLSTSLSDSSVNTTINDYTSGDIGSQFDALPTAVENRTEMDSNSTQLTAIVADTNEMQGDLADGGRLDLIFDTIAEDTTTDIPALIAGLNDPTVAQIRAEMEGDGYDLSALVEGLINKQIITESNGDTEVFNDAGSSQGTVSTAFSTDGTYTTRLKIRI